MEAIVKGRTQFSPKTLKGANLEKLIEDYKQIESPANVQAAWEEVNGKYTPKKKKKAPKEKEPTEE